MQEIERYNALVSRMEKDQEEANYRLEELMRENQQLKAKVLDLERQEESISIHEEQEI